MVKLLENADQNASCSTEASPANGNRNGKEASKTTPFLNGSSKVPVNGVSKVNGYTTNKASKVNGNSNKKLSNGNCDVQTDSGNSDDEVLGKEPVVNGQFRNKDGEIPLNGSNTPSEASSSSSPENGKVENTSQGEESPQLLNGSSNSEMKNNSQEENIHLLIVNALSNVVGDNGLSGNDDLGELSRQLHDKDGNSLNGSNASSKPDLKNCSTSQNGESLSNEECYDKNQKMGVNENRKKKNNKFQKKSKGNLSPVANGKSTHKNINCDEKESLPQKNPTALRNPGVTYSDALKIGTNKSSKSSNGNASSGESSGTQSPVEQLPTDSTKSAAVKNDKLSSRKSDKIKPKTAEVSPCTDKIPPQNPSQESANSTNNRPRDAESSMPSTKNISPGKSYSSALRNGANGNSQLNHQIASNCKKSEKTLANGESSGTCSSVEPLSITNGEMSRTRSSVEQLSVANGESTAIHIPIEQLITKVTKSAIENALALSYHPSDTSEPEVLEDTADIDDTKWSTMGISPDSSVKDPGFFNEEYADAAYPESVTSYDSGRGDSELLYDASMPYCCEFPKEKTSQLIGRKGTFKFEIERKSGVQFWVYQGETDTETNIICMTGTGAQIEKAKNLIKHRFRNVPLTPWYGPNPARLTLSEQYYARLPELTDFSGVVSCFNSPHCFWIQQYAHPQAHQLETLELAISAHFNTTVDAPGIDNPTIGSVVSVPACRIGDSIRWIRGQIVNLIPEENVAAVRYLDHGGDHTVPIDQLRPVRQEFFSIPFFAALCCLYDIVPTGSKWTEEALAEFTRLTTCPNFVPIVRVICKTPECYFVTIFAYDTEMNQRVDLAAHLISKGLAARPQASSLYFGPEAPLA